MKLKTTLMFVGLFVLFLLLELTQQQQVALLQREIDGLRSSISSLTEIANQHSEAIGNLAAASSSNSDSIVKVISAIRERK